MAFQSSNAKATPAFSLERLIQPIAPTVFKQEYWERKPLIIRRNNPDYYEGLLSLSDVDQILSLSSIRSDLIRVLRNGKETPLDHIRSGGFYSHVNVLELLYSEYRNGSTVVLQYLHERWKPLMRLCQSLATDFSAAFQVNAYLTPAQSKGLNIHYDTHDVFVLQTEGSKHWRIWGSPIQLPLKGQPYQSNGASEAGEAGEELVLNKGDLIYLPRGYLHGAETRDSTSLHLTVGVLPITWAMVLLRAVESVIEKDARFRESLPPGFATIDGLQASALERLSDLLKFLVQQIEPESILKEVTQGAFNVKQPSLDGHLLDLEVEPHVSLETRLRRRPDLLMCLTVEAGELCLYFHGKVMRMPDYLEPDIRFISQAQEFRGVDLPGELDDAGKLLLIRKLLHEGFLTID
jgi:ribosomal protein L16 Arg81 hydroxylase